MSFQLMLQGLQATSTHRHLGRCQAEVACDALAERTDPIVRHGRGERDAAKRLQAAFASGGFSYAAIGGLAVIVRGYPRATRDIDAIVWDADQHLDDLISEFANQGLEFSRGRRQGLCQAIPGDSSKDGQRVSHRCFDGAASVRGRGDQALKAK